MVKQSNATKAVIASASAVVLVLSGTAGYLVGLRAAPPAVGQSTGWFDHALTTTGHKLAEQVTSSMLAEQLRDRGKRVLSGPQQLLAGIPFKSFHVRLSSASQPGLRDLESGSFGANAIIDYRLPVDGVVVSRTARATFQLRHGAWRLTALKAPGADLWDHEPVSVVRSGRVLVIGHRGDDRLADLATAADDARSYVEHFWGARWSDRVVVVMPSNAKYLDALVGDPSGSDQVAVTLWSSGANGRVVRVMVNPSVYDGVPSFVRSIILRHEITHVAQDALPQSNIPGWLTEGVASTSATDQRGFRRRW